MNDAFWLLLIQANWLSFIGQDHLPRNDTAYNGLTLLPAIVISTQEHVSQPYQQTNLMEAIPQLNFSFSDMSSWLPRIAITGAQL